MKHLKNVAIVISLLISIFSLVLSIKTMKMSKKEYETSRALVLKSEITKSKCNLKPIDHNQYVQSMFIYLPGDIDNNIMHLTIPELQLPKDIIEKNIIDYFNRSTAEKISFLGKSIKSEITINNMLMPIVIDTFYVAKNEQFFNRSMYRLIFDTSVAGGKIINKGVKVKGIMFYGEMNKDIGIADILTNEWRRTIDFQISDPKFLPDL